jgi:hypothetical protein
LLSLQRRGERCKEARAGLAGWHAADGQHPQIGADLRQVGLDRGQLGLRWLLHDLDSGLKPFARTLNRDAEIPAGA